MKPYLSDSSALTFTVASDDSAKGSALKTGIEGCTGCQEHNGQSYSADVSEMMEAHESGLSFGKYAAYLTLSQYDSTITVKDCKNMTMKELHDLISQHEADNEHSGENEDDNCTGDGNQNHYGNGHND